MTSPSEPVFVLRSLPCPSLRNTCVDKNPMLLPFLTEQGRLDSGERGSFSHMIIECKPERVPFSHFQSISIAAPQMDEAPDVPGPTDFREGLAPNFV